MNKLKELIDKYAYQTGGVYSLIDIEELCKEYVVLCLEKAAEEATIDCYIKSNLKGARWKKIEDNVEYDVLNKTQMYKVNKESITNVELP